MNADSTNKRPEAPSLDAFFGYDRKVAAVANVGLDVMQAGAACSEQLARATGDLFTAFARAWFATPPAATQPSASATGAATDSPRAHLDRALGEVDAAMQSILRSPEYLDATRGWLLALTELQSRQQELVNSLPWSAPFPTWTEFDDLSRTTQELKREVRALKRELAAAARATKAADARSADAKAGVTAVATRRAA